VIQLSDKHKASPEPLLRAGYGVVSAIADGNAYGNPKSRLDYRSLMIAVQAMDAAEPLFFVAESMGALPALALMSDDTRHQVKGMVGISPLIVPTLMGIPTSTGPSRSWQTLGVAGFPTAPIRFHRHRRLSPAVTFCCTSLTKTKSYQ
jgi:alpha-beta hydrolase superfamily lysophospholipase